MKMEKLVVDIELFREEEPISVTENTFQSLLCQVYHIGSHLPGWFKSLLPASALTVEERAWWVTSRKLKIVLDSLFKECLPVHQDSFQLPLCGKV